jgi:hypothetical protein
MDEPRMARTPTKQIGLAVATIILIVSASLRSGTAAAQESDEWKFRITPYLWMLSLEGTTAALGQDVDVDASFSDIFDVLNIALFINMELSKGNFFVFFDPMYTQLEADFAGPEGSTVGGKMEVDIVIADLAFGYSFDQYFGVYAGARYYDQDYTVTPNLLPQISLGDDWTDFIIGLRAGGDVSENWSLLYKMDFAVAGDSESAFYMQTALMRHFGDNMHLDVGWRYYDVDYESGAGPTRFKWDVAHSGPVVGFSWEFGG